MVYNPAITTIFPGATVDATNVTIPLVDLGITQAQAANNVRLFSAIADKYSDIIKALPTADKPKRFNVAFPSATSQPNGIQRQPISAYVDYELDPTKLELAPEV